MRGFSLPLTSLSGHATLEVFTSTSFALILSAVGHFALRAMLGLYLRFLAVGGFLCLGVVLWAFLDREFVRAVKLSEYISRDKRP
jgi:hypothetical protein